MRVGIDVRCFAGGKTTGVQQYTKNLLSEVFVQTKLSNEKNKDQEKIFFVLFFNAYKDVKIDFSWALQYDHVELKKFQYSNKLLNISLWYFGKPMLDNLLGGLDVLYMPNANFTAHSQRTKLIVTIHDLSYEHFKNSFSFKRKIWHYLVNPRNLANKADAIFTVSQSSRQDVIASYPKTRGKVFVLPGGYNSDQNNLTRNSHELLEVKMRYNLPSKFILYFGTIEPRKNIVSLIQSYESIRSKHKHITHHLVLAGSRGWNMEEIQAAIHNSPIKEDIHLLHDIPNKDREAFYILGEVFIYPSHFEGFGLPPLEALASNKPVITSHTTSLPEVVGTEAIMIDPTRPEEIEVALHEVLTSKQLQSQLTSELNEKKNTNFNTKKATAKTFIEILKQVVKMQ